MLLAAHYTGVVWRCSPVRVPSDQRPDPALLFYARRVSSVWLTEIPGSPVEEHALGRDSKACVARRSVLYVILFMGRRGATERSRCANGETPP